MEYINDDIIKEINKKYGKGWYICSILHAKDDGSIYYSFVNNILYGDVVVCMRYTVWHKKFTPEKEKFSKLTTFIKDKKFIMKKDFLKHYSVKFK